MTKYMRRIKHVEDKPTQIQVSAATRVCFTSGRGTGFLLGRFKRDPTDVADLLEEVALAAHEKTLDVVRDDCLEGRYSRINQFLCEF